MVDTITLKELYKHGIPYYIKTDIEGNDTLLVKELFKYIDKIKPKYLSFELSRLDYFIIFSYLILDKDIYSN
jgi:hypothetical protein